MVIHAGLYLKPGNSLGQWAETEQVAQPSSFHKFVLSGLKLFNLLQIIE